MQNLTRRNLVIGVGAVVTASALPAIAAPAVVAETIKPKVIIAPDIMWCGVQTKFKDVEENCYTIMYRYMSKMVFPVGSGKFPEYSMTNRDTDLYKEWLKDHPSDDGIPPHIAFGGAIVSGKGDPTFYARWQERTRERLAKGFFDHPWNDIEYTMYNTDDRRTFYVDVGNLPPSEAKQHIRNLL